MTKAEIEEKIDKIKAASWDYELAHMLEDALREKFIASIATRKDAMGGKARLVLSTNNIDFSRHCA